MVSDKVLDYDGEARSQLLVVDSCKPHPKKDTCNPSASSSTDN